MHKSTTSIPSEWKVELKRFDRFWLDMVVNPIKTEQGSSAQLISSVMEKRKNEVEEELQNKFIYYICSRRKVRFNTVKDPKFNRRDKSFKFNFIVGKKKTRNFFICFIDENNEYCEPNFIIRKKFITIIYPSGYKATYPIHEFLESFNANLGISSKVEYVGYTINPDSRPFKQHNGLINVLHNIDTKNSDIMIYYNTFRIVDATTYKEVKGLSTEDKYKLIEKCLIEYFSSNNQIKNRTNEVGFARNIFERCKIEMIHFYLEHSEETDYSRFFSDRVARSHVHRFKVGFNNSQLNITRI